jgi:hypothetical protein
VARDRRSMGDGLPDESVTDVVSGVSRRKKRKRSWERKKREAGGVVTWRLPPDLVEQVKGVSGELGVPVREVARWLLERGLEQYRAGRFGLEPSPVKTVYTLYPED